MKPEKLASIIAAAALSAAEDGTGSQIHPVSGLVVQPQFSAKVVGRVDSAAAYFTAPPPEPVVLAWINHVFLPAAATGNQAGFRDHTNAGSDYNQSGGYGIDIRTDARIGVSYSGGLVRLFALLVK